LKSYFLLWKEKKRLVIYFVFKYKKRKSNTIFLKKKMSKADTATVVGSVGCASGLIGLSLGIAALAVTLENRNQLNTLQTDVDNLETVNPLLVNDGVNVSDSISLFGNPPTTNGGTSQPQFHFKSLTPGTNISLTNASDTNIVISNTLIFTLQSNPSTNPNAFSLPSASSSPNAPEVRKIIAGTGITITIDSEDNLVISV